jgi:hypothetical protein
VYCSFNLPCGGTYVPLNNLEEQHYADRCTDPKGHGILVERDFLSFLNGFRSCHLHRHVQVEEAVVVRKLNRHLIPIFFTLGVCCYLDRSSLAFSSLQLMDDLGFSKTVYGLGAGAGLR